MLRLAVGNHWPPERRRDDAKKDLGLLRPDPGGRRRHRGVINPRFLSPVNLVNMANLIGLFGLFASARAW